MRTGKIIRKSRYQRLMDDIVKGGVKTKVLLLSATPVNNDLRDLRNQIYFSPKASDIAFKDTIGIGSLKDTLASRAKNVQRSGRANKRASARPKTCLKNSVPRFSNCSTN